MSPFIYKLHPTDAQTPCLMIRCCGHVKKTVTYMKYLAAVQGSFFTDSRKAPYERSSFTDLGYLGGDK